MTPERLKEIESVWGINGELRIDESTTTNELRRVVEELVAEVRRVQFELSVREFTCQSLGAELRRIQSEEPNKGES